MSILKLKPACKDYLWGGERLKDEYGVEYGGDVLAEAWVLSCHPDGPSYIANGPYKGKTLKEYIDLKGIGVLGSNCERFSEFPVLIKFIDAKMDLSIQVHPDDVYALKNEGQWGKTELWYILDAAKGAFLYLGFKEEISREEFEDRIQNDQLLEVLNTVPVKKGDVILIPPGTIHAIGKDILLAEIQQNSNLTYRVYDYGRIGKDGKKRPLHIKKALDVTNRVPPLLHLDSYPHVADCEYFTVDRLFMDGVKVYSMEGEVSYDSFMSILILDGEGSICCPDEINDGVVLESLKAGREDARTHSVFYKKGDSFFIPAKTGRFLIEGSCDALLTTVRKNQL